MQAVRGKSFSLYSLILPLAIAFLSALVAFLLSRDIPFEISFLKTAQLKTIDQRFEYRGTEDIKQRSKVVIVGITDQSAGMIPTPFPYPRDYYTKMIRNLFAAGARAIGIDIIMDEPSKDPAADSSLARTLRKYKHVVLAARNDVDVSGRYKILKSADFYHNVFMKDDSAIGVVLVENDPDGVYRRYMPFNAFQTGPDNYKIIPSFGFAVLSQYLGLDDTIAALHKDYFQLGQLKIPKYDETSLLINYSGPSGQFPTYDVWQVLDDSSFTTSFEKETGVEVDDYYDLKNSGVFKDKVVLIGAVYPESNDLKPIPYRRNSSTLTGNLAYGIEIHASAIETVLDGKYLVPTGPWFDFFEMLLGALLISLTSFIFKSAKHSRMFLVIFVPLLVTGVVIVASFWGAFVLFAGRGIVLKIVYPVLAYAFSYVSTVVFQLASERRQKTVIRSLFNRYVDPSVVNELVENPELVRLGGERKEMSVLFSDIANFTTVSESLAPEDLVAHLNEYLTSMTEVVFKLSGTLDKYIGDAIIAFWGAPLELKEHALRTCQAAIEMTRRLKELHGKWSEEKKPILNFRIGINSGEMIVGNVGGRERFDYTVIGDNVNLASRLESANKMYHTQIMMSEYTYEFVKEIVYARELDLIIVKGKTRPVRIFQLISDNRESVSEEKKKVVGLYLNGLREYRRRNWSEAVEHFASALAIDPDDYPSEMYLERCQLYQMEPPEPNWDGVFVMKTK